MYTTQDRIGIRLLAVTANNAGYLNEALTACRERVAEFRHASEVVTYEIWRNVYDRDGNKVAVLCKQYVATSYDSHEVALKAAQGYCYQEIKELRAYKHATVKTMAGLAGFDYSINGRVQWSASYGVVSKEIADYSRAASM